jgi:hypothetical protein
MIIYSGAVISIAGVRRILVKRSGAAAYRIYQ